MPVKAILERNNIEKHDERPLWKYDISDVEYYQLKDEILNGRFNQFRMVSKEVVFYIAEWWKREYNGGKYSWDLIIESLDISTDYHDEFVEAAKRGGTTLGLRWVNNGGNTQYLRTILLQGGLPVQKVLSVENGSFTIFLTTLLKKIRTYGEDAFTIEKLLVNESIPPMSYLPKTYRQKAMIELCLESVTAVLNDRLDLLPFSEKVGEKILSKLKSAKSESASSAMPIRVKWLIKDHEIYYSAICEKQLSEAFINRNDIEETTSIRVFFGGTEYAHYRKNSGGKLTLYSNTERLQLWDYISDVSCSISYNDVSPVLHIPGESAPDLTSPLLCRKDEKGALVILPGSKTQYPQCYLLLPEGWIISDSEQISQTTSSAEKLCINDNFFDLLLIDGRCIALSPEGDSYEYSAGVSFNSGRVVFRNTDPIKWIVKSALPVFSQLPKFAVVDDDGGTKTILDDNVWWRYAGSNDWKHLTEYKPHSGSIVFSVNEGENSFQQLKCFVMSGIQYDSTPENASSGIITLKNGMYSKFDTCNGLFEVNELGGGKFRIKQSESDEPRALIKLLLKTNYGHITVELVTPFKGAFFCDPQGKRLLNNATLIANNLAGYRIVTIGGNYEIQIEDKQNKDLCRRIAVCGESFPLWKVEDMGRNLFSQNDAMEGTMFPVTILDDTGATVSRLNLTRFNSEKTGTISDTNFSLIDDKKNLITEQLDLKMIQLGVTEGDVPVIPIGHFDELDSSYTVPFNIASGIWVIFSSDNPRYSLYPSVFIKDLAEEYDDDFFAATAIQDGQERKRALREILEDRTLTNECWQSLARYVKVMTDHKIPLSAYDPFLVISRKPELLATLFFAVQFVYPQAEDALNVLLKIEEELPVCWHLIPANTWASVLRRIPEECGAVYFDVLFKRFEASMKDLYQSPELFELLFSMVIKPTITQENPGHLSMDILDKLRYEVGDASRYPRNWEPHLPSGFEQLVPTSINIPDYQRSLFMSPVIASLILTGHKAGYHYDKETIRRIRLNSKIAPRWYQETLTYYIKKVIHFHGVKSEF